MGGFVNMLGGPIGTLIQLGVAVAMGIAAAMMQPNAYGQKLKNKTIASSTYGHPLPRVRGTVRLQGQLIFWNTIKETTHRKHAGGFFFGLIGGSSIYTYTYSTCCAFAFGKKLGGGPATKFIRIWADGKLLYSSLVSDAALAGTATVVGTPAAGSQAIPVVISSGGSLTLSAGDLIQFGNYETVSGVTTFVQNGPDYEVQQDVSLGSLATGTVDVYPPITGDLTTIIGGSPVQNVIFIPGLTKPIVDPTSFDPDPHDGSHVSANRVPNGTIRFHYGSASEQADPAMVTQFGASQAPAYRGMPYVMLWWLQLANYGNHVPSISAEIAFDTATGQYPIVGPIANATLGAAGGADQIALPVPAASSSSFVSPNNMLPYVWVFTDKGSIGGDRYAYKVNTRTNQVEGSVCLNGGAGNIWSPFAVDTTGHFYYITSIALNTWVLYHWDGQALTQSNSYGPANVGMLVNTIDCWDMLASFFGNQEIVKYIALQQYTGGFHVLERSVLLPFGTPNAISTDQVIFFWSKSIFGQNVTPVTGPGDITSFLTTPYAGFDHPVPDLTGNLWLHQNDTLSVYDCQPRSGIYIDPISLVPSEVLYPPSFDRTDIDVSVAGVTGGPIFYASDNSIIVLGHLGICKVDCASHAILATNLATPPWSSGVATPTLGALDLFGTLVVTDVLHQHYWRYDANTLQQLGSYDMNSWFGGHGPGRAVFDSITDSLWYNYNGGLYRAHLDRGPGDGIGLDLIVGSIFSEAGYDASEYDVTALSTITTKGYEVDQEPYLDSIKKLQELFLFDMAEIDGTIVCVPRSAGAGVFTITEDDLGATEVGTAPSARVIETLQQETDVPETVWVHYYDDTKQLQQATQYDKRISRPYASALVSNPKVTNSRNQLVISTPVTDSPGPMKLQARRILLDHWQARMRSQFKTSIKWIRLDPTDKGTLSYKGETFDVRLTGVDRGAGLALDFQGESYDSGIYSVPAVVNQPGGSNPPGLPVPPPPKGGDNYTLIPVYPLSQTSVTNLALAATVATFDSGLRTQYNARATLAIADPGAGNTQIYYVTIYDPTFIGEIPGTNSLTVFVNTTAAASHVGETGYINMGSIIAAGSAATGGNGGPGGQPPPPNGVLVAEIAFGPTTRGLFQVAHGLAALNLGPIPSDVQIQITVATGADMGSVEFQPLRYDAQYIYLIASEDGLTGFLEIFA